MNIINNIPYNTTNNCTSINDAVDPYENRLQSSTSADIAEQIIKNLPKQKVGFLAVDSITGKSVHYGSADYPLKKLVKK